MMDPATCQQTTDQQSQTQTERELLLARKTQVKDKCKNAFKATEALGEAGTLQARLSSSQPSEGRRATQDAGGRGGRGQEEAGHAGDAARGGCRPGGPTAKRLQGCGRAVPGPARIASTNDEAPGLFSGQY